MLSNRRIEQLNPDVANELRHNFALWLVYSSLYHGVGYDADIEPLHNPDWCKSRAALEVELLDTAKQRLLLRN